VERPEQSRGRGAKLAVLGAVMALTLGVHYGWLVDPIFGHVHWLHAVHGRFCYIPIVIAAVWFGRKGGIAAAAVISLLLVPYIVRAGTGAHDLAQELGEVVFYFAVAVLAGTLIEREQATRRRQQQAELQLERSQRLSLLGRIAAGVAHEIKNPLASIKGAADILVDPGTSPSEREEFQRILRGEVKRIDSIVGEFLDFARPKELELRLIDLSELVGSTLRQVEAHAADEGLKLRKEITRDIYVNGDAEKLRQVVLNLVLNAIQASSKGQEIRVALGLGDRGRVVLRIADSGPGIPEAALDRVFEPFFTTKSSGTGLGLAIAKDIVERHSGEIRIESAAGRGTTAIVELPLAAGGGQKAAGAAKEGAGG